ncbi:MAG: cytochrome-c peroxidase, partial [Crocinitomicaceae bacterium]|nr:cytochrome-c peroxidase [Crocinitomicaceae bacterium]
MIQEFGNLNTPDDNPNTDAKVELGRKLFFDKRLSLDNTVSCAICHIPAFGFTDRKKVSDGVLGRKTERNSPSLLNAGYLPTVMFDAHLTSLEMQVIVPIQEHVEMGMKMSEVIERLKAVPEYQMAARDIFNRDFDPWVLTRSISAFERTLLSVNSRFDQYYYGKNSKAMTNDEIKGWKLFSEKLYCTSCHPAPYFTTFKAENNGLYKDFGKDEGRFRIHHDSVDIGKFKVPSLRNIELTFPYMHDGSKNSIEEVISDYEKGGMIHWNQNQIITAFKLSTKQKNQL